MNKPCLDIFPPQPLSSLLLICDYLLSVSQQSVFLQPRFFFSVFMSRDLLLRCYRGCKTCDPFFYTLFFPFKIPINFTHTCTYCLLFIHLYMTVVQAQGIQPSGNVTPGYAHTSVPFTSRHFRVCLHSWTMKASCLLVNFSAVTRRLRIFTAVQRELQDPENAGCP